MNQTVTWKQKTRQFGVILLPILITQLALFAMTFFDVVMSGHAGPEDLAGVAIGSSIWGPVFTGLSGIFLAITPIVAQLIGAQKKEEVPFQVNQGIYLAIGLALAVILVGFLVLDPILYAMSLEDSVRGIAKQYLVALAFGIAPVFVYSVIRCFIDALGQTRITMYITLLSVPVNIALNYVLIFGKFGFPRLGGVGAGYASSITYWLILLISLLVIFKINPFKEYRIMRGWSGISLATWGGQLKIGIPIGFAIFFETSIFAAVTLMMSEFNTATIAAHQAALNFASFVYMIPMSIAMALTIAVGYEVGARRYEDAKKYCVLGIGVSVVLALFTAFGLYAFNEEVASLYTTDATVLELTKVFLIYAIFFQLSDGIAAPIQGALRGYKDVNITLIMAFISYWVLGLPIGYALVKWTNIGAYGYWIGLIAGLAFGAILLSIRLLRIQKRQLHPIQQPDLVG